MSENLSTIAPTPESNKPKEWSIDISMDAAGPWRGDLYHEYIKKYPEIERASALSQGLLDYIENGDENSKPLLIQSGNHKNILLDALQYLGENIEIENGVYIDYRNLGEIYDNVVNSGINLPESMKLEFDNLASAAEWDDVENFINKLRDNVKKSNATGMDEASKAYLQKEWGELARLLVKWYPDGFEDEAMKTRMRLLKDAIDSYTKA
jgi:hypothetical protein